MKQEMNDGITAELGEKTLTLALKKMIVITCQCRDFFHQAML